MLSDPVVLRACVQGCKPDDGFRARDHEDLARQGKFRR
jgi:hypothetical protein